MALITRGPGSARSIVREDTIASYLTDVFETGDCAAIADALGLIARTRGIATVADDAGLPRQKLYRDLSADSKPDLDTVLKVTQALGLKLVAVAAD
ncbi:addiction module antidote protein [Terrarubrum flagellatum]|uniref:addiction module antidote protein n=1 Tax=Terrirubrum flagellatum TaxID=2895980 RepID=UPI00314520C8